MKLDKEDKFYEIKLQTLKKERLSSLEAAKKINRNEKKTKATLLDSIEKMKRLQIKGLKV